MEALNTTLFLMVNATPASPAWLLHLAIFFARDLIAIVPLTMVALWLWGPQHRIVHQRHLAGFHMISSPHMTRHGNIVPHASASAGQKPSSYT